MSSRDAGDDEDEIKTLVMEDWSEDDDDDEEPGSSSPSTVPLRVKVNDQIYERGHRRRPPLRHRHHQTRRRAFEKYWPPGDCFRMMSDLLTSYENDPAGIEHLFVHYDRMNSAPDKTWSNMNAFIDWFGEEMTRELVTFALSTNGTLRARFNQIRLNIKMDRRRNDPYSHIFNSTTSRSSSSSSYSSSKNGSFYATTTHDRSQVGHGGGGGGPEQG